MTSRKVETAAEAIARLSREVADLRAWINVRAPSAFTRYTDAEAVSAMGAKADGNPLNHDRLVPGDIDLGDLGDVNLGTPSLGDVLAFGVGQWISDGGTINAHLSDRDAHHDHDSARAMVYRGSPGNEVLTSGSWTTIEWNKSQTDPSGWHSTSTNPSRITPGDLPDGTLVLVWAQITVWSNTATTLGIRLTQNGNLRAKLDELQPTGSIQTIAIAALMIHDDGDYYEVDGYQDQGSDLNLRNGSDEMRFGVTAFQGFDAT